jgi:hypothetical protein
MKYIKIRDKRGCKTNQCQSKCQQLQWKEKRKEENHVKMGGRVWRGFKYHLNEKEARNYQDP